MALLSIDDFLKRDMDGYYLTQPLYSEITTAPGTLLGGMIGSLSKAGFTKALPSTLPPSVTGYIVTTIEGSTDVRNSGTLLYGRIINLGSIDISGASGTFTDGDQMPTVTVGGNSLQLASAVICEVEVALNATPGSLTITYVDQDGNTAETTTAQTLTASSPLGSCGFIVLNTGDWGVRDITAATRSVGTTPTGTIRFWGVQPLGMGPTTASGADGNCIINSITTNLNIRPLPAGSNIAAFLHNANQAYGFQGSMYVIGDS